MALRMII